MTYQYGIGPSGIGYVKPTKPLHIFISSPYSDGDTLSAAERLINVKRSFDLTEQVARLGHYPFVPLAAHYWNEQHPHDHAFWMRWCKAWLSRCDAILYAGDTVGTVEELQYATGLGLTVFKRIEDIPDVGNEGSDGERFGI